MGGTGLGRPASLKGFGDDPATPFEFRMLAPDDERSAGELEVLWPLKRFPVLVDAGRTVVEASIIIEHLGLRAPDRD